MFIRKSRKFNELVSFIKFVSPALVLYSVFFLVPLFGGLVYSFTDWNGITPDVNFIGVKNYVKLVSDERFLRTLATTFKLAIGFVIIVNILALSMAVLLDTDLILGKKRKNVYRSIVFTPHAISLIIVAFIWQFMFTRVYSNLVNALGLSFMDISWFENGFKALSAVLIAMVWQSVGYYMVVFIAGLQTIDNDLIEAANMDGASGWKKFVHITLPLIVPSIIVNLFISITQGFKAFDIIFQMTNGGPNNATTVVALNIYREGFQSQEMGYGSAKSIVLCIIIIFITYFQIKFFKKKEVEM